MPRRGAANPLAVRLLSSQHPPVIPTQARIRGRPDGIATPYRDALINACAGMTKGAGRRVRPPGPIRYDDWRRRNAGISSPATSSPAVCRTEARGCCSVRASGSVGSARTGAPGSDVAAGPG